ncbi:MAG TPA: hypothetical protein VLS90_16195 [Thermodesulfobacteriota bacterium]|nr:hypothetical protein [Thermodesulfobacteriota bacterium]
MGQETSGIYGPYRKMDRTELAKEFHVWPWDVDDWLLWGCPARKIRATWDFDPEQVRAWLKSQRIKVRRIRPRHSPARLFDHRWFGSRCPVCMDRGFLEESAGRLYTFGEIFEGEWHLRRTGVPCGHSANLKYISSSRN